MNLYVIELLKKDGQPYKKARFVGDPPITWGIKADAEIYVLTAVRPPKYRIRTLTLLPEKGDE